MNGQSKKDGPVKWPAPDSAKESAEPRTAPRTLLLLTALPLCLALFAFLISDPPFEDDALPGGWADRGGRHRNLTEQAAAINCPTRPKNPNLMFPYRPWHSSLQPLDAPKICICTTTAAGLAQTLPWLFYHRTLGVELFLIFVEGRAARADSASVLESIPGVKVIHRTPELEYRQAHSRVWNETWLSFFFYKPCNYELFVRQSLNMEVAIDMAREAKMDWISHVDTDELLYPAGSHEFSLQRLLSEAPADADTVVFPNYETAIERDDIKDPFSEINMFKKNFDHVAKEVYFGHYKDATKGNPNYYLTYGNGKSAARVVDHLRSNGAHRFHNYKRPPKEFKFPEAAVLHYTYTKFSDLTSRRDRCGCKPTKEDVKRCFMLDFDRMAFIVASTQTEEQMLQWYREHVVWTDPEMNQKLLKKGLFGRIHTPQVIIRGIQSSGIINRTIEKGMELMRKRKLASVKSGRLRISQGAAAAGKTRREDTVHNGRVRGSADVIPGATEDQAKDRKLSKEELKQELAGAVEGTDVEDMRVQDAGAAQKETGQESMASGDGAGQAGTATQRRRLLQLKDGEYLEEWLLDSTMAMPPLSDPLPEFDL